MRPAPSPGPRRQARPGIPGRWSHFGAAVSSDESGWSVEPADATNGCPAAGSAVRSPGSPAPGSREPATGPPPAFCRSCPGTAYRWRGSGHRIASKTRRRSRTACRGLPAMHLPRSGGATVEARRYGMLAMDRRRGYGRLPRGLGRVGSSRIGRPETHRDMSRG